MIEVHMCSLCSHSASDAIMKHRIIWTFLVSVFCFSLISCRHQTLPANVPPAKIPTKALLLNATAFPGKWQGGTISDDDDYLADDIETWSANWGSDEQIGFFNVITERISRYPTSEDAYELFTNLIRT